MRRLTLLTLSISLCLAFLIGALGLRSSQAYSDPLSSPGTLNKNHYKLNNQVNKCGACHKSSWQGITNASCTGCHDRADFAKKKTTAITLLHLKMDLQKQDCTQCHTEHKGFTAKITKPLDHSLLPITKNNSCDNCHATERTKHLETQKNSYDGNCSTCHTTKGWKPAIFKHVLLDDNSLKDCASCHAKERAVHLNKNGQNLYDSQCSNCHTYKDWKTKVFNHDALPNAELNQCLRCHTKDSLVHQGAKAENVYGNNCGACHLTKQWKPVELNVVSILTSSLTSSNSSCEQCHAKKMPPKHIEQYGISCANCHQSSRWLATSYIHDNTKKNCGACHQKPNTIVHQSSNGQCGTCHFTSRWQPANFSHSTINQGVKCITCHSEKIAIHGGGYGDNCAQCHRTSSWALGVFAHPKGELNCSSCHKPPVTSIHKSISGKCSACHSTGNWQPVRFDHAQLTGNQSCSSCHAVEQVYHLEQYMVNRNCQQCHNVQSWKPAQFSHNTLQSESCTTCHVAPDVSYHKGLGNDCQQCHSTTAWRPAKFNHDIYGPIPTNHTQTCTSCHM